MSSGIDSPQTGQALSCFSKRAAITSNGCAGNGCLKRIRRRRRAWSSRLPRRSVTWRVPTRVMRHPWTVCFGIAGMLASNPSSALVAVVLLVGCATNTAPPRFLPNPVEAQTQAWGGWIEISYVENGAQRRAEGELIAVTRDSVWVLGTDGGAGAVVPTTQVRSGQLTAYDAQGGKVAGAAFLGTVSTISNGAFLILTAPLWIITGSVA